MAAKKRWRQHVNPLKMTSLVPRAEPVALPSRPRPVEVELGCGDGRFLIRRAVALPDTFFVGLDIRAEFMAVGRAEAGALGLRNLRLEESNLIVDADRLFPPRRVRRFWVNFPDPWFKRRHRARRWLAPKTLAALCHALAPRGEVIYQSDVWDLALEALGLLEAEQRLENMAGPWTFLRHPPVPQQTSRERACLEAGLRIWRMRFRRREGAG